jgi:AcrR family transcriptional regulator
MDREDVVQAAIGIADADGLAALTMHAVASALGFTTMALYRYFPSKEALIDACVDAAMGTPPAPPAACADWRARVTHWANAKRTMLCARPWLAELPFVAAPHGPNWLSWHEALLQCFSGLGLTPEDMMDMLSVVTGYVQGSSDTAISLARSRARGIPDEVWAGAVGADLGRAIGDPRFPALSAVLTSASGGLAAGGSLPARAGRPRTMEEGHAWGLERVLDGLAVYLESHRG